MLFKKSSLDFTISPSIANIIQFKKKKKKEVRLFGIIIQFRNEFSTTLKTLPFKCFHRKLPFEKYTNTRSLLENSISCNLTHLPTTYLRNKVNTEFPLNFHEQSSFESGSSRGWEEEEKKYDRHSLNRIFPPIMVFTRIILKKTAREHGQKLCTFETLLNNVCVPIERPMINDVDPLVTSEKFQPFFFFLAFFPWSPCSLSTRPFILSAFYNLYSCSARVFWGNFNDFQWFISGNLGVSFFFFLQVVMVDYSLSYRQFRREKP